MHLCAWYHLSSMVDSVRLEKQVTTKEAAFMWANKLITQCLLILLNIFPCQKHKQLLNWDKDINLHSTLIVHTYLLSLCTATSYSMLAFNWHFIYWLWLINAMHHQTEICTIRKSTQIHPKRALCGEKAKNL